MQAPAHGIQEKGSWWHSKIHLPFFLSNFNIFLVFGGLLEIYSLYFYLGTHFKPSEKKGYYMKKKKLSVLFVATALLLNAIPCYAAQSVPSFKVSVTSASASASSSAADYTSLPTGDTLKEDVGFVPKLIDRFALEYKFSSGSITETFNIDSNGSPVNRHKGISFKYVKTQNGVEKTVSLSAELAEYSSGSENASVTKYGEHELSYNNEQANSVSWTDGDIHYILMDINKSVSKDDLLTMAKELIDLKN